MEVTLLTENTRVRYTGDGVLKEFSYPFNPIDLSYVKVYKNLQPVTAPDVTISSGVVTFNTAPAEGDSIVIIREKPLTYDSGIVSKGIISPDSLDNLAVELLGQIQQVNEKLDRVPVYPIDTAMTGEEILNQFNQDVSDVRDAKISIKGKVEEIDTIVSSGLTEITEATSEGKIQITEEKNAALTAVETFTAPLIERAETAATEAEASRANAEEWAKSVDAENIVHRTGDESVDGRKTFTNTPICNGELWLVDTTGEAPDNPPSQTSAYGTLRWIVKGTEGSTAGYGGGQELFRIQPIVSSAGDFSVHTSYQYGSGAHPTIFYFGCKADGSNPYLSVPTPALVENSNLVATTKWTRQVAALTDLSNTILMANRAIITDRNGRVSVSTVTSTELGYLDGVTSAIQTQLNAKANLASPAFTGTPTAPTQASTDNSTRIATTAFVNSRITNMSSTVGSRYVYINNLLIQWGPIGRTTTNGTIWVGFPKPFANTAYGLSVSEKADDGERNGNRKLTINKTLSTTGFNVTNDGWTDMYNGITGLYIAIGQRG